MAEVGAVASRFSESVSDYFHPMVTRIERVQNPALLGAYHDHCASLGTSSLSELPLALLSGTWL